jgi:hypothetical protein
MLRNSSDGGAAIIFANSLASPLASIDSRVEGTGPGTNDSALAFGTALNGTNTEKVRITSVGNVGIGQNNPTYQLELSGAAKSLRVNGNGTPTEVLASFGGTGTFGVDNLGIPNRRFVVANSGSVGINNENADAAVPLQSGFIFQINGNMKARTDGANSFNQFYGAGGSQVGAITTDGTSTQFITTSDYRLKENIAPMTGALEKVAALKPCTYTWKADGSGGQGFIAHELQAVVPDCVTGEKDKVEPIGNVVDTDGNVTQEGVPEPHKLQKSETWTKTGEYPVYQGIDTSFLVATLVAAIQELKAEVDALKGAA